MTYAERCAATHRPLIDLRSELLADLDRAKGGFGWWHGYLDQGRIVLASDYLIGVTGTVSRSLSRAAFHESKFATLWAAKSNRLLLVQTRDLHDVAKVLHTGPADEDRNTELDAHRHGFFTAVGSALDQMAALTVGVAAIKMPIVKADWGRLRSLPTETTVTNKALDDPGTAGRMLQANVLSTVDTVLGRQPTGWLDWTIDMRNTLVHRADRAMLSYIDARPVRQSVRRLVNLLPRHPRQTDAEAFASGSRRGRRDGMTHLVLQEDTTALMSGTLDCSLALVAELADVLLGTWQKRRADPTLLVQPGQQWKNLWQGPVGTFDGYKPGSITDLGDQIQVPTEMARRMEAAKLLDADQAFWDRLREEDARPEP